MARETLTDYDLNIYIPFDDGILDVIAYPLTYTISHDGKTYLTGDYQEAKQLMLSFPLKSEDAEIQEAIRFLIPNPEDRQQEYDEWDSRDSMLDRNPPRLLELWLKKLPEYEVETPIG